MLSLLLAFGCADPQEPAPLAMEDACRGLLRDFGDDAVVDDVEALADWLDGLDEVEDGYRLDRLADQDVEALEHPDELDVAAMDGALVAYRARGSLDAYAAVVPEEDQSFADGSYERWARTVTAGSAEGYLAGQELSATDDIVKSAVVVTLPYTMRKDWRWVETSRGPAQVMRSWVPEVRWSEDGENAVLGDFTAELWYPDGDDGIVWLNASWTTLETDFGDAVTDEDFWVEMIIDGSRAVMEGTEAHVSGDAR